MSDNFSRPQHTAPLTPILQLVNGSPIVLVAFFAVGLSWLFLLIGVIFLVVGGLGYWASWRKNFFWINEKGELEARSGIFFRRSRQLRISRLQSVDILRPPVARLLGYSSLKVEVAGSGDSRVILSYLSVGKAQELRSEILSVAKEEQAFTQSAERENHWQWRVPNGRLVASMVLTTSTFFVIVVAVASAVIALRGSGLVALALAVGGSAASLAGITSLFNFSVGRNERGIAISHGFFTTAHYTVSPIRIQAICLVQPIAWRPFGWYQIAINVAGTDQSGKKSGPRFLIPVVHEDALPELFRELLPSWNLETEDEWLASATT
ncbi:MAG: PH domain-containing protein, partial [Candidatus Nanopelagicales bacterium]